MGVVKKMYLVERDLYFRVRVYDRVATDADAALLPASGQEEDVLIHSEHLIRHVFFATALPRQRELHGGRCRYVIDAGKAIMDQGMRSTGLAFSECFTGGPSNKGSPAASCPAPVFQCV